MDIPVLEDTTVTPTELPDGYNRVRYSPVDFGAAGGEALQNVGKDAADYAQYLKQKNDSLAVTAGMNQLSDKVNDLLSNPDTGLLNRKGKDSLTVPQDFQKGYEQAAGDVMNGMSNLSQRSAFAAMAASERRYSQMRIDTHIASEMQQFQDQTYKAAIMNAQNRAITSNGDPDVVSGALGQIGALVRAQSHAQGWSEDTTQYMLAQAQSDVHEGVIQNMLTAGNAKQAQSYYDAVKGDISGSEQNKIQAALKVGVVRNEATSQAQKIIADNPGDLAAQIKAADKVDDPDIHDEVVRQISNHDELLQRAQQDQKKQDMQTADTIVNSGKGFNAIPPAIVARMTTQEFKGYHEAANYVASGVEPPQNWAKWTDFTADFAKNPTSIAGQNLMTTIRPYVDNEHYNQAVDMQKAAIQATQGDKTKLTALQDPMERFNNTVFPVAFPSQDSATKLTGADKARYGQLLSTVQNDISTQELQLGRKLTPVELQKTMDDFVHEQVFVHHTFLSDEQKPVAALTKDEQGNAYVPLAQIPPARLTGIQNYIQSVGAKPSDDKVQRIYAAAILGDDEAIKQIAQEP